MMEHIFEILSITFVLSMFVSLFLIYRNMFVLAMFVSMLLCVGSFLGMLNCHSKINRFYREACFSNMAQTHPSQWEYENKKWKIVRSKENIYLFNHGNQYTVETTEDGGFMIRNLNGRIEYIVSKNGDVLNQK